MGREDEIRRRLGKQYAGFTRGEVSADVSHLLQEIERLKTAATETVTALQQEAMRGHPATPQHVRLGHLATQLFLAIDPSFADALKQ